MDEAFAAVNALAQRRLPDPRLDLAAFYEAIAATEVVALRKRIGDSAVETVFREAIRKQPFVIRQVSAP
jgi:hypothetical protein